VLGHDQAREIAEWADGNAHDALAALFAAADAAAAYLAGTASNQRTSRPVSPTSRDRLSLLGRVLALPANRQSVLRELVGLDAADRATVMATTDAIAASVGSTSPGTVKRFLYELAESGILAREENTDADRRGRPPSRVEPRFPPTVFARLYDLQNV